MDILVVRQRGYAACQTDQREIATDETSIIAECDVQCSQILSLLDEDVRFCSRREDDCRGKGEAGGEEGKGFVNEHVVSSREFSAFGGKKSDGWRALKCPDLDMVSAGRALYLK